MKNRGIDGWLQRCREVTNLLDTYLLQGTRWVGGTAQLILSWDMFGQSAGEWAHLDVRSSPSQEPLTCKSSGRHISNSSTGTGIF